MVILKPGAVILVHFPFSDLSQTKLRPAVVLADAGRGDWILCQVTSNPYGDARAIELEDASFNVGADIIQFPSTKRACSGPQQKEF